jgi:4-hydroxyphenylpyruvate dioxygenase-like putative hemolysin|tara:strand:- start:351 stop:602 length:252 start_codon:yes stop_codon:yes gene_type:complete
MFTNTKSNLKKYIEVYQDILPSERERLQEMKNKIDSHLESKSFLSLLRVNIPFGLQYEYDNLDSWINWYTEKLSYWKQEYEKI